MVGRPGAPARPDDPGRRPGGRNLFAWFVLLGLAALVLLVHFDLGPPIASTDDWVYRWMAEGFARGRGLHLFPEQSATGLVGVLIGAVVAGSQADIRILRLTAVPFVVLVGWSLYRLCSRMGASVTWALVGALVAGTAPTFLGVATSFMTEAFYIGLLLGAAVFSLDWIIDGRNIGAATVLTTLAVLERQNAIGITIALTLVLFVARARPLRRGDVVGLALLWLTSAAALGGPLAAGLTSPMMALRARQGLSGTEVLATVAYLPGQLGFLLMPLLFPVASRVRDQGTPLRRAVIPALLISAAAAAALLVAGGAGWLPGNGINFGGLNPVTLRGPKPALFGLVFPVLTAGAFVSWIVLAAHHQPWTRGLREPRKQFLALLAATQLLGVIGTGATHDRYYLTVVFPLVPVFIGALSTQPMRRADAAWVSVGLVAWLAIYAVGQQDYQAWQLARDEAARRAFRESSPLGVDAGYEANAVYGEIPLYESSGRLLAPLTAPSGVGLPTIAGPPHPTFRLRFGAPGSGGDGVSYWSLAPGRVVIERVPSR